MTSNFFNTEESSFEHELIERHRASEQENTVVIPVSEYKALLEAQQMLNALESMGVNNWEGYEDAVQTAIEDMPWQLKAVENLLNNNQ